MHVVATLTGWKTYLSVAATLLLVYLWTAARVAPVVFDRADEPWISPEVYNAGLAVILPSGFGGAIAALRQGVKKSELSRPSRVGRVGHRGG